MKTRVFLMSVVLATGVAFTSCDDDDDIAAPVIGELEVGVDNSHIGYIGSDLHLETEISAAGKINEVKVEIHKEDGSGDEIEATYDDYSGLLNATFHQHVDIPAETAAGAYHLHITVTDMNGRSTSVEEELTIEVNTDTEPPVITISEAPAGNAAFSTGQSISISGHVSDNQALAGMLVALVRSDGGQDVSQVILMKLDYYQDTDEVDFTATIDVGAAFDNQTTPAAIGGENAWRSGGYWIWVRAFDSVGQVTDAQQYPITINL